MKTANTSKAMEKLTAMGFTIEPATAEHIKEVKANMSTEKPEIIEVHDLNEKTRIESHCNFKMYDPEKINMHIGYKPVISHDFTTEKTIMKSVSACKRIIKNSLALPAISTMHDAYYERKKAEYIATTEKIQRDRQIKVETEKKLASEKAKENYNRLKSSEVVMNVSAVDVINDKIKRRKPEKAKRPVQTVQTKKAAETVKTAENVKKSTYDIAVEKMTRMQAATKKDNDINRLSRYISDYLNNYGYTEKTKNHIATVLTPLAIRIVKNKLYAIQYRKDRTYSIYNDPIMIELFRNYRFEKIDPLTLHFSELITVDRQSYSFNSDSLKKSEQCTKAAEYTATTIAADLVNECILSLLENVKNMYESGKFVDLLSCYIIPYNTTDKNGIDVDPKKWRYKAVNAVNIAGDVIETVFADYERNKHKSLDDFNTLYDRNGYEKTPAISAISDSYGDIEITEEMTELLKNWIDKLELSETVKAIAIDKYINGLTVEQIAAKIKKCNNTVEKHLINFRNALRDYINNENPDKIKKTCNKRYIVMYNEYGKITAKYDSINAVARALNVHKSAIQKALRSPRVATCKGYTLDIIYT